MNARKAEIAEVIGIAIHEHEDAHLDGVSLKQRRLAAHIADALLLYLRAQIEDLPTWSNEDWRDDGFGGSEHRDIYAIDRAEVLELLGSSLSAVPGTETEPETAKTAASPAVGRDVR